MYLYRVGRMQGYFLIATTELEETNDSSLLVIYYYGCPMSPIPNLAPLHFALISLLHTHYGILQEQFSRREILR